MSKFSSMKGMVGVLMTLGLAVVMVSMAGCAYSQDQDVFDSPPQQPTSIALIDTVQKKVIWSMDIPVGDKLVIDYNGQHLGEVFTLPAIPGKQAVWALYRIQDDPASPLAHPIKQGTIELAGNPVRAKVSYRPMESEGESGQTNAASQPSTTLPEGD